MSFGTRSINLLTHSITKAKLVEFSVAENERPPTLLCANDLLYSTIHALSAYSIMYAKGESLAEVDKELEFISTYYQSFVEAENDKTNYIWVLLGVCANILCDNFGNAKALFSRLKNFKDCTNLISETILNYASLVLEGNYYVKGRGCVDLLSLLQKELVGNRIAEGEIKNAFTSVYKEIARDDPEGNVFFRILYAIYRKVASLRAIDLVPRHSDLSIDVWKKYFDNRKSIKVLWQAQRIIIEKDVLKGKDAFIQLPTGTGKTKCVELIAASAVLTRQVNLIIYVAPLKALCNEVKKDLDSALSGILEVDDINEVLQEDDYFDFAKKQVIICTPEKLNYLIKNNKDIIENCGLIVFDEAHMFDDGARGVTYEILVTRIKDILPADSQKIFISAVLPNAESIRKWAIGDNNALISDDLIKKTEKNIAFYSTLGDSIVFLMHDGDNKNIRIPNPMKEPLVVLERYPKGSKKNPKGSIKDYYPKKDDAKDVAINLALKFCKESGVAIYMQSPLQVRGMFSRLAKLADVGVELNTNCDIGETNKIANLIREHYGEGELSSVASIGVLPHYGELSNGVRLAVEFAIKRKMAKIIVCTSTLAEGVNLPIRYLLMTSFANTFQEILSYRKFKNLFGRTARSGTYTEGSMICTDGRVLDYRNDLSSIRSHQWKRILALMNDSSPDDCGSSILMLCNKLLYGYKDSENYDGKYIIRELVIPRYSQNLDIGGSIDMLIEDVKQNKKPSNQFWEMKFSDRRYQIVSTISLIESFIIDEVAEDESFSIENAPNIASRILQKTLANHLATDEEQSVLLELFTAIATKIAGMTLEKDYGSQNVYQALTN